MGNPSKHKEPVKDFNEALIKYIIESNWYPNGVTEGGGTFHPQYGETIGDARTYREARNRILQAVEDGGIEYLKPAIRKYQLDHGSKLVKYSPESYNLKSSKMEPILVDQMQIADVDAKTGALANLMSYNDNGKEKGALNSFLEATYGGDGILKGIADAHSFKGSFGKEGAALAKKIEETFKNPTDRARLKRELGFSPKAKMSDVANALTEYAERSYRAYARNRNIPAKALSVAEGFVAPQIAASMDEGRDPNFVDIGTDVGETYLLGSGKIAKKVGDKVLKSAGIEAGLDLAHDALNDALNEVVYSEGSVPIRSRNYSDLTDPWRAANLLNAAMYGGIARSGRAINKVLKQGGKSAENAVENSEENVMGAIARKVLVESKLRDTAKATREVNALRKKSGLQALTEKEVIRDIKNELKEAKADVLKEKQAKAASSLFGTLSRIGGTRGMYNPNLAPKASQWFAEMRNPKEQK